MAGIKQIVRKSPTTRRRKPKEPTTILNQDEWLLATLEKGLTKTPRAGSSGVFYPSTLCSPCERLVYLAYNGLIPPKPIPAHVRRIFDCGDYLGNRFHKYFSDLGLLIAAEQSVKHTDPPISGRLDYLIKHEKHGRRIIELKSINDKGFKLLTTDPKIDHFLQLQIYLNLVGLEHGVVLYENKNDQQVKAFEVFQNTLVWDGLLDKCFRIMSMVDTPKVCTREKYCRCREVEHGTKRSSQMESVNGITEG